MKRINIAMAGVAIFLLISFILLGSPVNTYPFPERQETETEKAERGYLGVSISEISEDVLEAYGLKDRRGVLITNVADDSPADKAGLKEGDVITEFDGKPVDNTEDLTRFVRGCEPGSEVQVKIMRQGKAQTIKVTIGKLRLHLPMIVPEIGPFNYYWYYPRIERGIRPQIAPFRFFWSGRIGGLTMQNLNPSLGEYFQRESGKGVLVLEVKEDSQAAEAGFLPGDVIISIDGKAVDNKENLNDILKEAEEGDKLTFEILRKGKSQKLTVEMKDGRHLIIMGEPKLKKAIPIPPLPVEDYCYEIKMDKLPKVLELIQEGIDCRLREIDLEAMERAMQLMEKKLQQSLVEDYRYELKMDKLQGVLDNLEKRINCQLRELDTEALERAMELIEKSVQQALEKMERVTKKLGSTTARLHRLGWSL